MFLSVTHCLVMIIICAKIFINLTMHNNVMGQKRTGFTEAYALWTVTLTFDLAILFLFVTYCFVMMIICAIFFQIPPCMARLWAGHKQVSLKHIHNV